MLNLGWTWKYQRGFEKVSPGAHSRKSDGLGYCLDIRSCKSYRGDSEKQPKWRITDLVRRNRLCAQLWSYAPGTMLDVLHISLYFILTAIV